MIISNLLSSSSYIIVNKNLIKLLGINETILLGELCSECNYWESINRLEDGYFYSTRENIEENTGLSAHNQRMALKTLENKEIISMKQKGIPCKTYYRINEDKIIEHLKTPKNPDVQNFNNKELETLTTCNKDFPEQVVDNIDGNNNNIINNIIINSILSHQNKEEKMDEMDKKRLYENIFKQNIEYEKLIEEPKNSKIIKDIKNIVVDTLISKKKYINIASELKSSEIVKSQLLKLRAQHIEYVINSLEENKQYVKNRIAYILTTLYNAVNTFNLDVTLEVARCINADDEEGVVYG